jgi:hypothetical protein
MKSTRLLVILSSVIFVSQLRAQSTWDITDSIPERNWGVRIASFGNVCVVASNLVDSITQAYYPIFWRSDDAGRTWRKQDPQISGHWVNGIAQVDSLYTIVVGDSGLILASTDAGVTWHKEPCPVTSILTGISCVGRQQGIIIGVKPIKILVRLENSWSVIPFRGDFYAGPVPNLSPDYEGQLFCHAYGEGKYRVTGNGYYSDSLKQTVVPLYTTTDNWQSVDSVMVPFWPEQDGAFHTYFNGWIDADFGNSDTLGIIGWTSPDINYERSWGIFARTFDGGHHWDRIVDSGKHYNGFFRPSPLARNMFVGFGDSLPDYRGPWLLKSGDWGSTWAPDSVRFVPPLDPKSEGEMEVFASTTTADGSTVAAFVFYKNYKTAYLARLRPASSFVRSDIASTRSLDVYPNPVSTILHISCEEDRNYAVIDALGRSSVIKSRSGMLDVSALAPGMYTVTDKQAKAKFVKQ